VLDAGESTLHVAEEPFDGLSVNVALRVHAVLVLDLVVGGELTPEPAV
jgi:hypothetical protein